MGKDENGSELKEKEEKCKARNSKSKSKRKHYDSSCSYDSSDSEHDDKHRSSRRRKQTKKRSRRRSSKYDESSSSSYYSDSESGTESENSESEAERRERKRKREKERRKEKEKRREKEKMRKERKKKKEKKKEDRGKKGAVTNSWGKYGVIRETDMWNKRPEFTAWLLEVKQVNLETLANWEEKQMFKEFMEDHNTATFPSKKYYNLDAYHARKMEKELKKGLKKATNAERTVFNDEEQRRLELQRDRERRKEEEIEALKRSMQGGMAQAMKEQARLREEMAYQYRIGNHEAAAAIQRRLDPDVAM